MMHELAEWAEKWSICEDALIELKSVLCGLPHIDRECAPGPEGYSEAAVTSRVRLEATKKGVVLWRNNVGACYTKEGRFIRYGLLNQSKRMNEQFKSSDLIGIRPVVVTSADVGRTIGQFVAREAKASNWRSSPRDAHEMAQRKFLNLVASLGGDAAFANREGTL